MATYLESSDEDNAVFEIERDAPDAPEAFVHDVEGLEEKLAEFARRGDGGFGATLEVTSEEPVEVQDVDDDLQRELRFYQQALSAAKRGIRELEREGVAWLRPEDYYAEMVKSDRHMARIKDQLLYEQKRIALAEQRRKARDARRFSKQVQAAKQREKQTAKKEKTRRVEQLRTQRQRMGFGQEFDWDLALDEVHRAEAGPRRKKEKTLPAVKSRKRMYKDAKYGRSGGFGPARRGKGNTAESSGDMRAFASGGRVGKRRRMAQKARHKSQL